MTVTSSHCLVKEKEKMNQNYINLMNIAGEGVMCAVLLLLLISCFYHRKDQDTVKALKALIITDILLLICQMAQWYMLLDRRGFASDPLRDYSELIKLAYAADFFLYYLTLVLFYNYAKTHINGVVGVKDAEAGKKSISIRPFIIIGIILTVAFAMILHNDKFYFWDSPGKEIYDISVYWVFIVIANFVTFFAAVSIIKYRKLLGRFNFGLLLAYIIVPPVIAVLDIIYRTSLSYLVQAFFIITIYILIDLRMERELNEKRELVLRQEKELTELNTKIMLSQIQPHFLNNILYTISALCYMDGAYKARNVVDKFAVYMRENLDALGSKKYISFDRELSHIETYLWLEQIRFGDALSVEYDIEVSDFIIPSLSVQPLVENAVKHGIRRKKGGGTVRISTKELPNEYLVIIDDDGAGFDKGGISEDKAGFDRGDIIDDKVEYDKGDISDNRTGYDKGDISDDKVRYDKGYIPGDKARLDKVDISEDKVRFGIGDISGDGRSHTGIGNVRSRIQILCGGSCDVVSKKGEGTTATLHIPKQGNKAAEE